MMPGVNPGAAFRGAAPGPGCTGRDPGRMMRAGPHGARRARTRPLRAPAVASHFGGLDSRSRDAMVIVLKKATGLALVLSALAAPAFAGAGPAPEIDPGS